MLNLHGIEANLHVLSQDCFVISSCLQLSSIISRKCFAGALLVTYEIFISHKYQPGSSSCLTFVREAFSLALLCEQGACTDKVQKWKWNDVLFQSLSAVSMGSYSVVCLGFLVRAAFLLIGRGLFMRPQYASFLPVPISAACFQRVNM